MRLRFAPTFHPIKIVLAAVLLAFAPAVAMGADEPENSLGTWIGATSTLKYSDTWGLFLQGEVRTWEVVSDLNEMLFRVAGHYNFNPKVMGAIGYVRVDTWPYPGEPYGKFDENRFFQELLIKSKWGQGKVDNRFRLEQRWITTDEFGTELSIRVRYMLGYTLPLNNDSMKPGTNFFKVFNEIFIDLDRFDYWFDREERAWGLNQNRLYVGFGRQVTALSNIQVGFLWQHRPKGDFLRLLVTYSHNFDFRGQ